jgi:hypothetical protein
MRHGHGSWWQLVTTIDGRGGRTGLPVAGSWPAGRRAERIVGQGAQTFARAQG